MGKIHKAIRKGDTAALMRLLDSGANVNELEKITRLGPLHQAAGFGNLELMSLLIGRGADLRLQGAFGTPLHLAETPEAAQLLMQHGVEVDIRADSGATPLFEAARGPGKPQMVSFFLDAGADPTAADGKGRTPLDITSGKETIALLEAASGTVKRDAAQEFRDAKAGLKLEKQARNGDVERVRALLAEGIRSDRALWQALVGTTKTPFDQVITDDDVVSWIMAGARMDDAHSEIAHLLIGAGSDVNAWVNVGLNEIGREQRWSVYPPLAAQVGGEGIADFAIRAMVFGTTGVFLGGGGPGPFVVSSKERGITPLFAAVINDDASLVSEMLAAGADVNAVTSNNETLLHWAVLYASKDSAPLILDAGADVNARTEDARETPLAWAQRRSEELPEEARAAIAEIVHMLQERGSTL